MEVLFPPPTPPPKEKILMFTFTSVTFNWIQPACVNQLRPTDQIGRFYYVNGAWQQSRSAQKYAKCACINEKVNRSPSDLLFSLWSCSLGNTMWLDPLVERKYLPNINVTTNALNVRMELLREKRAAENKQVRGFSALTLVWKVVGNLLFWYNIPSRVAYVGQMRKRDPLSLTVELTVLSNPDKLSTGHTGPVWKL